MRGRSPPRCSVPRTGARPSGSYAACGYRTRDAGASWQPLTRGLPDDAHFGPVLRDALCTDDGDPAGIYFGTRNGEIYASADDGDTW